ncbi:MAG: hypothetical protein ACPHVP_01795 [Flavobacteriales bacterium]
MKCSVEISMYPLDVNYIEPITFFIKRLKRHPFISLETNGMSTQVFGDYDNVMTVFPLFEIHNTMSSWERIII